MEWQPIESVPFGKWVLLSGEPYGDAESNMGLPVQIGMAVQITEERYEQAGPKTKRLVAETRIDFEDAWLRPTHWMPLPVPAQKRTETP